LVEVSFGEWLKRQRKAAGLTQEQLALQINCSTSALRKFEAEERHPSVQVSERLIAIFKIPQNERTSFLRFARGDWKSAPGRAIEDAPWHASTKSPRSNLPASLTSLIGREQEIAVIGEYLSNDGIRLVTLIGPPGIGKTRLSIEAAREALSNFPDGVFFVALALLDDPTLIPSAIAHSLGFISVNDLSVIEQLKEGISDKHMLFVMDNCEHLIEDVASLASDLLSTCSRLKILATSRESLRVPGEWLYPLPSFEIPKDQSFLDLETAAQFPALTLFAERARAVRPDFVLNAENIQTVASICAHLDGLPLVIELIAARMRLMSPDALLARLNDQFILSADGMRAASARQKTLNHAIGWSYNLLSKEEQKLFARLSVFSGGFTLEAAEAIFSQIGREKPISDLVASLLDKSLLQYDSVESNSARYAMLVTIQQFARTRLRQAGEEAEIRGQHLAYFLDLVEQADKDLRGPNQLEWLHRLGTEINNLRTAQDWALETKQTEIALQLARKLHWFWFVRGDHIEGIQWLRLVLAMPDTPSHPNVYAEALTQLAHHTWLIIGSNEARPLVEQALAIARAHDDKHNIARALAILGLILTRENNFAVAQSTFEESEVLFREVGDKWGFAHTMMGRGLGTYVQDDQATSLALHEQALVLFREVGDRYFQGVALRFIGNLRVKQGDWTRGVATLRKALILALDLNSKFEIYAVTWSLAEAAQCTRDSARAVRLYWAAKNIAESVGAWWTEDEVEVENNFATCRADLDEKAFETAMEQGRALTMKQAIVFALENSDG
jgi:predicted ATPase/transcriptional regulator with XRE-family HTH domain